MMRVLIVKLSPIQAITSSMFRTLAVAKGLCELGFKIDFVTIPMKEHNVESEEEEFINRINVITLGSNPAYTVSVSKEGNLYKAIISFLKKIWHKFVLYDNTIVDAQGVNKCESISREYDIVISSSDPKSSHKAVIKLIKDGLKYKKWIQYWGDPFAMDITRKSIYPNWLVARVEQALLKKADKIVYVSPITYEIQKKLFPKLSDKMSFLPTPYINEKIYKKADCEIFTVGYFGAYSSSVRNIIPFYNASVELGKGNIRTYIIGDSDLDLAENQNVTVLSRRVVNEYEEKADLIVCLLNLCGSQIPGKIYHMAGTNKPILVILDGDKKDDISAFLKKYDRFYMCDNNTKDIIRMIKYIKNEMRVFYPVSDFNYLEISKKIISDLL